MSEAVKQARTCLETGDVPVGAVVVRRDEIVGVGRNRREDKKNALWHAEICAINDACEKLGGWRLWECDLYVTLEPCAMCAGAISNSRIRKVFFGASDPKAGAYGGAFDARLLPLNHKPLVAGGIMEEECSEILKSFFEEVRKMK